MDTGYKTLRVNRPWDFQYAESPRNTSLWPEKWHQFSTVTEKRLFFGDNHRKNQIGAKCADVRCITAEKSTMKKEKERDL